MSDAGTPVNIEINDKVNPSVAVSIRDIAAAAAEADEQVLRLRAQLTGLGDAAQAQIKVIRATEQATAAYLKNETALNKAVASEARATEAYTRSLTAKERLNAATSRTVATELSAEAAMSRALATEDKATRATVSRADALIVEAKAAQAAADAQLRYNEVFAAGLTRKASTGGAAPGSSGEAKAGFAAMFAEQDAQAAALATREKFLTQLQREAATYKMSTAAAAEYKAAQLGLSVEAAPLIAAMRKTEEAASGAAHGTASITRELFVGGREIANGNYTRLAGSMTLLAQYTGVLNAVLSPTGLAIGAVVAIIGTLTYAAAKGANEIAHMNNELAVTGNYAGLTTGTLRAYEQQLSATQNARMSSVSGAVETLAYSGKVQSETLKMLAADSVMLAARTGESSDAIAKDFLKMTDGVTKYAIEYNSRYHQLNITQIDYIRWLEETGDKEKAEKELAHDVYVSIKNTGVEQLGYLESAWRSFGRTLDEVWDKMKGIGRDSTHAEDLAKTQARIAEITADHAKGVPAHVSYGFSLDDGFSRDAEELKNLQAQLKVQQTLVTADDKRAKAQADQKRAEQDAIDAGERLNTTWSDFNKNVDRAGEAIAKFRADLAKTKKGYDDKGAEYPQYLVDELKNQAQMESNIRKRYDPQDVRAQKDAETAATRRAKAIDELNLSLKNQMGLMDALQPKNDLQKKFDEIEQDLLKKGIDIRQKGAIKPIELPFVLKPSMTPAQMRAAIQKDLAATDVKSTADDANKYIAGINAETTALRTNVFERDIQDKLDKAQEQRITQGKTPYSPPQLAAMREALLLQKQMNDAQRVADQPKINAQSAADGAIATVTQQNQYTNNLKIMYDRIKAMRDANSLDDQQQQEANGQVALLVLKERLANEDAFFSELSGLQNSKNKELAAIGKAAAIAKATMDGYLAVQAALIGPPGPPWSYAIAAATAAVVASNVANIAGIQFAEGGLVTGPGGPRDDKIPARLSNGEYVVKAAATQRHMALLQAINDNRVNDYMTGGANYITNQTHVMVPPRITVEQHGTQQTYSLKSFSEGEIRLIAKDVAKGVVASDAPRAVATDMGRPNNPVASAIVRHTTAEHKRKQG